MSPNDSTNESKEMDQKVRTIYKSHLAGTIKEICRDNRYDDADVILVSEEQIPVQAHKIVLGGFSSTLKHLLFNNHHPKPLLYLRGVEHEELLSILRFLYLGKVNIDKTRMNKFMEVAIDLQIDEFIHGKQFDMQISDPPGEKPPEIEKLEKVGSNHGNKAFDSSKSSE